MITATSSLSQNIQAGSPFIAVGHGNGAKVSVYPWTETFGTKVADPATVPPSNGYGVAFTPSGGHIAVAHPGVTSFISVYPWTGAFGTKVADPATLIGGNGWSVAFTP